MSVVIVDDTPTTCETPHCMAPTVDTIVCWGPRRGYFVLAVCEGCKQAPPKRVPVDA